MGLEEFYKKRYGDKGPASGAPSSILPAIVGQGVAVPPSSAAPTPPADVDVDTGAPAWERMLSGFYSSPEGKAFVLSKKYGNENARIFNGYAEFKNPSTGKWTRLDEAGLSGRDLIDFVGDIPEITAGILGEIGGGLAGTAVAGPVGAVPGAVAGAGVGQMAGAGMKRLIQSLIGKREEFEPGKEFLLGVGSDLVGRGVSKGISKMLKPFEVEPMRRAAVKAAESAGVPLTAAQQTGAPFVEGLQNFIERFPMANRSSKIVGEGVGEFGQFVKDEVASGFGRDLTGAEAGNVISRGVSRRIGAVRAAAKHLYNDVWSEAGGAGTVAGIIPVNLRNTAETIKNEIERGAVKDEGVERFLAFLSDGKLLKQGQTLQEMAETRSSILDAGRQISKVFSKGKRYLAMLNNAAEKDISDWGKTYKLSGVVDKLTEANKFYKDEMKLIFDKRLGNIVTQMERGAIAAEDIPGRVFRGDASTRPELIREIIGEAEWRKVQGWAAYDIVKRASVKGVGDVDIVSPKKLQIVVSKLGKDELDAVFSNSQQEALKNFARIGSLFHPAAVGANPSGTGQAVVKHELAKDFLLSLGIGGGAYASTQSPLVAGGVLAAGPIMSKVLQSRPVVRYLSDGFVDLSSGVQRGIARAAKAALVSAVNSEIRESKPNSP